MKDCPTCKTSMVISELHCEECNLNLKGSFRASRLARLSQENMELAEKLILSSGNLKQLADITNTSYPTLRRRVDKLIAELEGIRSQDEEDTKDILTRIEEGKISAKEGLRLIKEMNGEL